MGFLSMFENDKRKVENIVSKEVEKYVTASVKKLDDDLIPIQNKINTYKGIVVFPQALDYNPIDRPQNILRTFAKKGFLCFFCVDNPNIKLQEIEPNLFIISNQERLLPLFKGRKVLFLITYFLQYIFAKTVENRMIWFDIMGRIDKYKYYNNYSIQIYKEIMNEAIIATYRTEEYKKDYEGVRENVMLLKDGIMIEDFINDKNIIGNDLRKYLFMNKKVIGYYGDINQNIDFDLIKKIDSLNTYIIILIGKMDDAISLKEYSLRNTYVLPNKDYSDLKKYVSHFDLVFFPLKNDIDHTLYKKTLESSAMKRKIITYENDELKALGLPNIIFVKNSDELINVLNNISEKNDYELPKKIQEILIKYSWENVINKVLLL